MLESTFLPKKYIFGKLLNIALKSKESLKNNFEQLFK